MVQAGECVELHKSGFCGRDQPHRIPGHIFEPAKRSAIGQLDDGHDQFTAPGFNVLNIYFNLISFNVEVDVFLGLVRPQFIDVPLNGSFSASVYGS